jgi:hypothetical protein
MLAVRRTVRHLPTEGMSDYVAAENRWFLAAHWELDDFQGKDWVRTLNLV